MKFSTIIVSVFYFLKKAVFTDKFLILWQEGLPIFARQYFSDAW
ncbi:hypothetical protein HMPREF9441_03059 [Paraprevotella clara YIT 11840]|uniref:Uncharacterized protein n=1 Tax=Paraprevotella clara YIT 11840 TaxID=762968 RepID=G5SUJ9_9BACT|nr:hypothetical protein HMPREF9441_03059 [Paraprevotella clara YIT 11840]